MNTSTPDVPGESPGGLDARFCEAMNAAPVMIWVSGKDELRQWFNKAWLAFTGRTVEQEKGHGWTEGVHRDDYNRCVDTHKSHLEARRQFRMQYRLRRYDGEYRWVDDIGVPRFDPDGTFLGFIGSCTDIHEYKAIETRLRELQETLEQRVDETAFQLEEEIEVRAQTEQHLFESSGQLAALIDGIKDCAIYMLDTEGRVASWNTGAERIKGYAPKKSSGSTSRAFTRKLTVRLEFLRGGFERRRKQASSRRKAGGYARTAPGFGPAS